MLCQPNVFHIVRKFYQIRLYLKNTDLNKVGAAKNVIFVSPIIIDNKLLYSLNERLIFRKQIRKSTNKLLAIEVKGFVSLKQLFRALKKCLPTVFDEKIIRKMNNEENIRRMYFHVRQSIISILGVREGNRILEKTFEDREKNESLESNAESMSEDILSDFEMI